MPPSGCLSVASKIWIGEDVLSERECAHFIRLGTDLRPGLVVSNMGSSTGCLSATRSSRVKWIGHHLDATTTAVGARLSAMVGLPLWHAEDFHIELYESGGGYDWHPDAFPHNSLQGQANMTRGGQRLATVIVFLNDCDSSGRLEFWPPAPVILHRRGRVVFAHHCEGSSTLMSRNFFCRDTAPEAGQRWQFKLFFHEEPYRRLFWTPKALERARKLLTASVSPDPAGISCSY